MNPGAARDVLMVTKTEYGMKNRIYKGLEILANYDNDIQMATGHEIIYACAFDQTVFHMDRDVVVEMGRLGWFCDKELDCWCHWTN